MKRVRWHRLLWGSFCACIVVLIVFALIVQPQSCNEVKKVFIEAGPYLISITIFTAWIGAFVIENI